MPDPHKAPQERSEGLSLLSEPGAEGRWSGSTSTRVVGLLRVVAVEATELSAHAGEAGLVFYKLPLSKTKNRDKPDIVEGRAKRPHSRCYPS